MKKRFLKSDKHGDFYDPIYGNQFSRTHRNFTKDVIDYMEDEESDVIDDIPSRSKCSGKHRWDRRYTTNAAERWLRSKVNQPWNKNRQEFFEYTDGKVHWMVEENTTMIDGVLHINDWCGPRTIDSLWRNTFYVDEHGILKYYVKEKRKRKEYANRFLIHEGYVWFRRDKTLFYSVPLVNVKKRIGHYVGSYYYGTIFGDSEFVFGKYEGSHRLPWQLKDGYVKKADIKQAPKKEVPEAAYSLGYLE